MSLEMSKSSRSCLIHSSQVSLGLPLLFFPSIMRLSTALTEFVVCLLMICLNHLSLPFYLISYTIFISVVMLCAMSWSEKVWLCYGSSQCCFRILRVIQLAKHQNWAGTSSSLQWDYLWRKHGNFSMKMVPQYAFLHADGSAIFPCWTRSRGLKSLPICHRRLVDGVILLIVSKISGIRSHILNLGDFQS